MARQAVCRTGWADGEDGIWKMLEQPRRVASRPESVRNQVSGDPAGVLVELSSQVEIESSGSERMRGALQKVEADSLCGLRGRGLEKDHKP
jgi:hypothetical protein